MRRAYPMHQQRDSRQSNIDHLAEEMADVCICIEALKQIYGISDEQMQTWIDLKQKRIEDRMLKGE